MAEQSAPALVYRVPLGGVTTFEDVGDWLDHMARLGVSHLRLPSVLEARPGSPDQRDVADHSRVSQVLGGEDGLRALAERCSGRGMGLLSDVVADHLAIGPTTTLWERLLAEGRSSDIARAFDVDWEPPLPGAENKIVLPVLSQPYGQALAAGDLRLAEERGDVRVRHGDQSFPLSAESRRAIERVGGAERVEGIPGQALTWSRMHALLEQQHYRLVDRRAGGRLVNYRRHLDIHELPALRVEDDAVFDATHDLLVALHAEGVLAGFCILNLDGLADPQAYLERLRERAPGAWVAVDSADGLRASWPASSDTGLSFLRAVLGVHVDAQGLRGLARSARRAGALNVATLEDAKLEALERGFATDVRRLARAFWTACQDDPSIRDVDFRACLDVVTHAAVNVPAARTYSGETADAVDRERLEATIERARVSDGLERIPAALWDQLLAILTGGLGASPVRDEVRLRFQQVAAAVHTVGLDRITFGRHHLLPAANEVGCNPFAPAVDPEELHRVAQGAGMATTATPDAHHGEDLRLRWAAFSELLPFDDASRAWLALVPEGLDEGTVHRLHQTVVAAWPTRDDGSVPLGDVVGAGLRTKVGAYLKQVVRDDGRRTSHLQVDEEYEQRLAGHLTRLLDPSDPTGFLAGARPLARRAAEIGIVASLTQTLLRCTCPRVPEVLPASERWDERLGDAAASGPPDRFLDPATSEQSHAEIDGADPAELWASRRDGRVKYRVLARALATRAADPDLFGPDGVYEPLHPSGRWAEHVIAFARRLPDGRAAVVIAPRLVGRVTDGGRFDATGRIWADTAVALPEAGTWRDALTDREHRGATADLSECLGALPAALLVRS